MHQTIGPPGLTALCVSALGSALLIGCSDDGVSGGGGGSTDNTGTGQGASSGNGFTTGSGSTGNSGPTGCERVDIVISVDNSSSMDEEKLALSTDVFPAFASALLAVGGGLEDYRIAVKDACPTPGGYNTAGVSLGPCNFSTGQVWMESTSPDLVGEFACVGDVDSSASTCSGDDDDEQPASAAAASLESPASTGANAGFLRDDALLVVIAITDEDELPVPSSSAQQIHDRLVASKGGDASRMVFLGIGGLSNCQGVYGSANQASLLKEVTDLFAAEGRGVFWDLCVGQLQDGLGEAMGVIEEACAEFPAPQ